VLDKVVLELIFLGIRRFCLVVIIPPLLYTRFFLYNGSYIISAIDSVVKQHALNKAKNKAFIHKFEINSTYFKSDIVISVHIAEKTLSLMCEENA
jgi:hypothetical protein